MGARRKLNRLSARIAVSEAAAWTGRRFYGGRYRVIPNGVALPEGGVPRRAVRAPGEPLRIAFVGRAVERKGLPVLLRAFEALRREVPAELTVVGVEPAELAPLLLDGEGVRALGRVGDAEKRAVLEAATCCARRRWAASRSGWCSPRRSPPARRWSPPTSPATATSWRDGVDGLLVPRGDATRLGEALRDLALDPARTARLGAGRGPQRRALRVAAGGRRGRRGLRGGPRGRRRRAPLAAPPCASARCPPTARARPAAAAAGAGAAAEAAARPACARAPRAARPAPRSPPRAARAGAGADRHARRSGRRCSRPARPGCWSRSG